MLLLVDLVLSLSNFAVFILYIPVSRPQRGTSFNRISHTSASAASYIVNYSCQISTVFV